MPRRAPALLRELVRGVESQAPPLTTQSVSALNKSPGDFWLHCSLRSSGPGPWSIWFKSSRRIQCKSGLTGNVLFTGIAQSLLTSLTAPLIFSNNSISSASTSHMPKIHHVEHPALIQGPVPLPMLFALRCMSFPSLVLFSSRWNYNHHWKILPIFVSFPPEAFSMLTSLEVSFILLGWYFCTLCTSISTSLSQYCSY